MPIGHLHCTTVPLSESTPIRELRKVGRRNFRTPLCTCLSSLVSPLYLKHTECSGAPRKLLRIRGIESVYPPRTGGCVGASKFTRQLRGHAVLYRSLLWFCSSTQRDLNQDPASKGNHSVRHDAAWRISISQHASIFGSSFNSKAVTGCPYFAPHPI